VYAEWALMVPLYVVDVALLYAIARLTLRWIENPANGVARRIIARFETP
jgi:peptidoglycan/LPS O-acetylase OafA/YrhL